MSEIERAIEYFEKKIADGDREVKNYVGMFMEEARKQWIEVARPIGETTLRILRAELSRQENAPLTWDEVVASEGKPVFIYGLEGEHGDDGWSIVGEKYERSGFTFVNLHDKNITNCGLDDLYGKTWIAYRYEPKGANQ